MVVKRTATCSEVHDAFELQHCANRHTRDAQIAGCTSEWHLRYCCLELLSDDTGVLTVPRESERQGKDKDKLVDRIEKLLDKENARHEKAMERLKTGAPPTAPGETVKTGATPAGSAATAPAVVTGAPATPPAPTAAKPAPAAPQQGGTP